MLVWTFTDWREANISSSWDREERSFDSVNAEKRHVADFTQYNLLQRWQAENSIYREQSQFTVNCYTKKKRRN